MSTSNIDSSCPMTSPAITVNSCSVSDHYPIPDRVWRAKYFCKQDMTHGYWQDPLDYSVCRTICPFSVALSTGLRNTPDSLLHLVTTCCYIYIFCDTYYMTVLWSHMGKVRFPFTVQMVKDRGQQCNFLFLIFLCIQQEINKHIQASILHETSSFLQFSSQFRVCQLQIFPKYETKSNI